MVEEKRKLIEVQIKEALFDNRNGRRVFGATCNGEELFSAIWALDPVEIAQKLGKILIDEGRSTDRLRAALGKVDDALRADNAPEIAARLPYFCAGCPHNSSTKVPSGSRAYAGIGCHYMVQWMDRETLGFTQMGGEGVNWVGEAPFSTRKHVFQNLGDGTYNHSGVMAIRAALATNTNITYKILYNDAVAMTGGQNHDGDLPPQQIARELLAMGVKHVAVVYDQKEQLDLASFPSGIALHERQDLEQVQRHFAALDGVSALLFIQTCAAEKRRRRKRGQFPDPDARLFINPEVCEGCGDCGVQSNCVALMPLETELGRKRQIDQSGCNKDFTCVNGFCPSFVTLKGARLRKSAAKEIDLPALPHPVLPDIKGTWNVVLTGVGGSGVVTLGALLAQAAHLDGKGAGMMEMAGLAQKGGAVHVHCRLANTPQDISAIRVSSGECDALIGGDLVVSAGAKTLGLTGAQRTAAVVNAHDAVTGDFTRDPDFKMPDDQLKLALRARLQDRLDLLDATTLAKTTLGDSIFSNMVVLGAAWQRGLLPLPYEALKQAITLNGTAVARNIQAFEIGRWAVLYPKEAAALTDKKAQAQIGDDLQEKIRYRATHLQAYQNAGLAQKYRDFVARIEDPELRAAVADNYHKLLAYKDEYEVARLLLKTKTMAQAQFEGDFELQYHLAPPLFTKTNQDGRAQKMRLGSWFIYPLGLLSRMKPLRGTFLDLFGYTRERKSERNLIVQYQQDITHLAPLLTAKNRAAILELAQLPQHIRGFGPLKAQAIETTQARRATLLQAIHA